MWAVMLALSFANVFYELPKMQLYLPIETAYSHNLAHLPLQQGPPVAL
jgi:hypothetical protein